MLHDYNIIKINHLLLLFLYKG